MNGARWPDERLDDRFSSIDRRLDDHGNELFALRNLLTAVSSLETEVREARADVDHGFESIRLINEKLDEHVAERRAEDKERREERKRDLKWLVGTILAAAGIVIAGVSLLAGHVA